jgi:hypothetical protein
MHSRPIETCWNAEIVHSCPSTVLAPMRTSPSWQRTFVVADPRPAPEVDLRVLADLELHAGADEADGRR